MQNGVIVADRRNACGADVTFEIVTVTGTENVMMAAVLWPKGVTRIFNAACEPEITDLAELLTKMGKTSKAQARLTMTINGVDI